MGHLKIELREISNITGALSSFQELLSYITQLDSKNEELQKYYQYLLDKYKTKYLDHRVVHEWESVNFHVINQCWGSTSCGWGGIGGAAMTNSYTTIIENRSCKIAAVYWDGKLAYLVHLDEVYDTFIKTNSYHRFPGLDSVKARFNTIYVNIHRV